MIYMSLDLPAQLFYCGNAWKLITGKHGEPLYVCTCTEECLIFIDPTEIVRYVEQDTIYEEAGP